MHVSDTHSELEHLHSPSGNPRARALGIPFEGTPGRWNSITDVPGVEVGYATIIEGTDVRTGVTAIHPRGKAGAGEPCAAGFHSQNGNGEMTGISWIHESGYTSGPVCITNTHSVGTAHAGIVDWTVNRHSELASAWLLPVAGETWDGYLNDINGLHVKAQHVVAALDGAESGLIAEGSVGGGTGMNCYEFKGGSGTSSRLVTYGERVYTVGVFLQANFGSRDEITIAGVPLGAKLSEDNPMRKHFTAPPGAGSCIAIVLTDAPLLPNQCQALARRVTSGLARTGTTGSHFSGDLFLAQSVGNSGGITPGFRSLFGQAKGRMDSLQFIPWGAMDRFFDAVVQATEEAVVNALVAGRDMVGMSGRRSPGFPKDKVIALLREQGVIRS
jgi:L-aminopeptidase/D-esterase-like protein